MSKMSKILIAVGILFSLIAVMAYLVITDIVPMGISSYDGSFWIGSSKFAKGGYMYLCGESHAKKVILDEELRIWQDLYHNEGMRHYFFEYGYSTAYFFNQWMQADDNVIFDNIYKGFSGTNSDSQYVYDFYMEIKRTCPETIFHGTDVTSGGNGCINYLEQKGLTDTEEYRRALEGYEQFQKYYNDGNKDYAYREGAMAENFIREYRSLGGLSIFGVYGSAHTAYPAYLMENVTTMLTTISRELGRTKLIVENLTAKYQGQY